MSYSDPATVEYNYEPYMKHKQLLLMILNSLRRDTTHWVIRREAVKVLGIVDALDPSSYRANNSFIKRVNRQIKREQEKTEAIKNITLKEQIKHVSKLLLDVHDNNNNNHNSSNTNKGGQANDNKDNNNNLVSNARKDTFLYHVGEHKAHNNNDSNDIWILRLKMNKQEQ